ncbi:hypothetical protein HPB52_019824 [Rhipicephalus sanguineus]|uniref:Uncharacterized protein n=1 Tax=Rhipicephalus sanguineus TaxID=34632 RepID=A0A9D4PGA9_RHISA|nr:hypothetical protein HPB52_019824 [Rhipicephalus sanguineus]
MILPMIVVWTAINDNVGSLEAVQRDFNKQAPEVAADYTEAEVRNWLKSASTCYSYSMRENPQEVADHMISAVRETDPKTCYPATGPLEPPLCLRCRGTGQIRRECRVPRCGLCRRYGHDETQCVRSYASVTGSGRNDAVDEHLMDQADAEATVSGGGDSAKPDSEPQTEPSEKNVGRKDDDAAAPAYDTKEIADADTDTNKTSTTASTATNREESHQESTDMECDQKTVVKRPREKTEEGCTPDGGCAEEALPKTPVFRRTPMKFKPKVPLDKRTAPPADPP